MNNRKNFFGNKKIHGKKKKNSWNIKKIIPKIKKKFSKKKQLYENSKKIIWKIKKIHEKKKFSERKEFSAKIRKKFFGKIKKFSKK